ncbi:unnamed protein product [Lactuca saligna]|uniref:Uncharacterized protein n=1 Tax=Lactuca saligna TaxID=75948 RepID=A0AA36EHL6_LACSI|nr:unnamed protein product [Lactuca saligna]
MHKFISCLKIGKFAEGIKSCYRYRTVLIGLDDVNHLDQLNVFAGSQDWFGEGGRIITSRDEHSFIEHRVDVIHKIVLIDNDEVIQLFRMHGLKPIEKRIWKKESVVNICSATDAKVCADMKNRRWIDFKFKQRLDVTGPLPEYFPIWELSCFTMISLVQKQLSEGYKV